MSIISEAGRDPARIQPRYSLEGEIKWIISKKTVQQRFELTGNISKDRWDEQLKTCGETKKSLLPSPKQTEIIRVLIRNNKIAFLQYLSGHNIKLKHYRHLIGIDRDDKCRLCGKGKETTIHLVANCQRLREQRYSKWNP